MADFLRQTVVLGGYASLQLRQHRFDRGRDCCLDRPLKQNDHHRAIVSSIRLGPEVFIGSYTLCGMPIEKDGEALESSHPIGPPGLSQQYLNEWVIHL